MASPDFVELHCHSAYSFLDGASDPAELAATAAGLGHEALALTDHDNVCGAMEFAHACKGVGVRPIIGCELTVEVPRRMPRPVHVTLLVENARGWASLCRLITEAHRGTREPASNGLRSRAPSHMRDPLPPSIEIDELERHTEGLVCLSGCARDGAVAGSWERGDPAGATHLAERLLRAFGPEHFRVELQRPLWRHDRSRNRWLASLAEQLGIPAVATGDAHAHERSRLPLQDAMVAVRLGATLDETEAQRRGNSTSALLSPERAIARFRDHPEAVAETERLAERLRFDLTKEIGYSYPGAEDEGADRRLAELSRVRLVHRYEGTPHRAEAERRLDEELALIRELRLSGFFLLHQDMLELAREVAAEVRGAESARRLLPPGRGRGSSVSSLVCYLTGLSHIDPVKNDLFLGRFLNEELTEVPDIDLDFPRDIREKLIPRVHERYGPERSALVASFATYRARGAIRDLGKALGLPLGEVERFARAVDVYEASRDAWARMEETLGKLRARSPRWRALAELLPEIAGLPRHMSQHPGGMVISTMPLIELCPVQPAAMEGRQIVQWDKDSCADAGFLKIDLLGLGMLSAVERCVDEIARTRGKRIDLSHVPLDDHEVWSAIQRAETTGVFQIESRAQMQMLPRTLPRDLDDLTVQVALVRPGPIQGGAVHPYIERRKRLRADPSYEVPYEHPSLEPVLRDTLGAIVFQDQVLEVSMALAGFSVGEAEGLRRAMSRKRSQAAMERYRVRFIEGATGRGVSREVAERVFGQIEGFSEFGFPKSHSAAFGLLAYQSMWLRVHYGPELLCALLNEQPMGFYPPDALVHEAQRRGLEVLPPGRQRQRARLPGGDDGRGGGVGREPAGPDRPRIRRRGGRDRRPGRDRRAPARRLIPEHRRPRGSLRRERRRPATVRLGGCLRWPGPTPGVRSCIATRCRIARPDPGSGRGAAATRSLGGGRLGARHPRRRRGAACSSARRIPDPATARARALGADRGRLPDHRDDPGPPPNGADPGKPASRPPRQRGPGAHPRRRQGERGGDGRRPPAPGDRQRGRLHAARGRAGHDQPDRASPGRRAPSPGGPDLGLRPGMGQARAPRGHHQRRGHPDRSPQHRRAATPADPRARAAGAQGDRPGSRLIKRVALSRTLA